MDTLWTRPVAHRGLHGPDRPENSLSALAAGVELGLPVELDVRVTSDGVAVLHHDVDLRRMCGIPVPVAELSCREVTQRHLLGGDERIPTLAEALDLVGGRVPVLVDCKVLPTSRDRARMLDAVLRELGSYRGQSAVVGFDPFLFARLRALAPHVLRGQSAGVSVHTSRYPRAAAGVSRPLDRFWLNPVSRPHFLTYNVQRLPQTSLARLRERGMRVLGWTVREPAHLREVAGVVDNVIAEGPAMSRLLAAPAA